MVDGASDKVVGTTFWEGCDGFGVCSTKDSEMYQDVFLPGVEHTGESGTGALRCLGFTVEVG